MALRSVTVTLPPGNSVALASKALGTPGAPFSRMVDAALRAYRGEPRDEIKKHVHQRKTSLEGSGRKITQVDDSLTNGLNNISRAIRIGLALLMYEDMTLEEATEWEEGRVLRGRPAREATTT